MKKTISAKGFLVRFACFAFALLLCMGALVYAIDPYFHYHKPLADYVINDRFCMDGLIRDYDYDAALIGSSMCQNFDMDLFREQMQVSPIKAVKGGMRIEEASLLNDLIVRTGKAKRIYLNIDLTQFNSEYLKNDYYPDYLLNDAVLDDYLYLYGYEAWMRYLPLDLLLCGLQTVGRSTPGFLKDEVDPDLIGEWQTRSKNKFRGGEYLVKSYLSTDAVKVSRQDPTGMYERMCDRLDRFLESGFFDPDTEYIVFLAPYSSLYWYHTMQEGYFETLCDFREYYYTRLSAYDNVRFFDFQSFPGIENLDQYKDVTHYHKDYNDQMVGFFASGEYEIRDAEEIREGNEYLKRAVAKLLETYPELPRQSAENPGA